MTSVATEAAAGETPVAAAPPTIGVSPAAVEEIAKASGKREKRPEGLRVGVRGGGCTGFSYMFEWSDKPANAKDLVLSFRDDTVKVFIDPKSLVFLRGSTLDFTRSLMQRGFKWVNPNAKGTCGCGDSVQF